MQPSPVELLLHKYAPGFHPVVPFAPGRDKLLALDFTAANTQLTPSIYNQLDLFSAYINNLLNKAGAKYGIGGYAELRVIYAASEHFDDATEPRRLHLGIDIWAAEGTPVFAFMGGSVHSVAYNGIKGDYGATLVLLHQLEGYAFYTLYGHISCRDIEQLAAGQYVVRGQEIAHLGTPAENGQWPPHLHFQVIIDMQLKTGDYPGVCKFSERSQYLQNCPDPDLILQMRKYA
ncbi:MAG TPA: peptidoglycan DD-metalloendopeptidase family protein [Chitinophagaceae bacterium]|nr:peptidoglycan DD-metalloendopeptidase family protein [Chitinophagaceae bacterium]